MPPRGWRKPRPEPGSSQERAILLDKVGLGADEKAILLSSALAAIRAGLSSDDEGSRLRAASMALGLLNVKPSRNPMAPTPAPQQGVEPEDDWTTQPATPLTPAKPSLKAPVEWEGDTAGLHHDDEADLLP